MNRRAASAPLEISLSEEGGIRYLHFGTQWVQGAMRISRPDALVLDYIRQMMAWMLFTGQPRRLLQLGLGAGALTRFCLKHCADTDITVVDNAAEVIEACHRWFAVPRSHPHLAIVHDDAMRFLEREAPDQGVDGFDVIQVDLYDMHARGPAIESPAFYARCVERLTAQGIAVFNLFGLHESTERNLARISDAFDGRTLAMPITPAGNLVVLGFRSSSVRIDWAEAARRATALQTRTGLPALAWVTALERLRGTPLLTI